MIAFFVHFKLGLMVVVIDEDDDSHPFMPVQLDFCGSRQLPSRTPIGSTAGCQLFMFASETSQGSL